MVIIWSFDRFGKNCKLPVFIVLAAGQGPAPGPAHRYRRLRPLVVPRPHPLNKILLYQRTIVYHVFSVLYEYYCVAP